jgi:hypothetical protein
LGGVPFPLFVHAGSDTYVEPNYDIPADGERALIAEPVGSTR